MGGADMDSLERLEQVLVGLVAQRARKPVYRKLLVELYSSMVRVLKLRRDADPAGWRHGVLYSAPRNPGLPRRPILRSG